MNTHYKRKNLYDVIMSMVESICYTCLALKEQKKLRPIDCQKQMDIDELSKPD